MFMNLSSIVPVSLIPKTSEAMTHTTMNDSTPKKRLSVPVFFIVRYR